MMLRACLPQGPVHGGDAGVAHPVVVLAERGLRLQQQRLRASRQTAQHATGEYYRYSYSLFNDATCYSRVYIGSARFSRVVLPVVLLQGLLTATYIGHQNQS